MLTKVSGNIFREVNRVKVTKSQCDELGHMNIQYYYAALSDGMFRVMELIGIPKEDIPTRRTSFALHKEEAEFLVELKLGDEFYVATALSRIGIKSIIFENRFFSVLNDHILFKAKFISVYICNYYFHMGRIYTNLLHTIRIHTPLHAGNLQRHINL